MISEFCIGTPRCFCIYKKRSYASSRHMYSMLQLHTPNSPLETNQHKLTFMQIQHFSLSCNSDVKLSKKGASLTLSYHLHLKDFYLLFRQPKAEDTGIMPTLLLSSYRKYYGVILVFPGHTPLGNCILVQMSHPGSESLDTGSISSLIYFKILPNHSFFF